ncbi:flagellar brake protein [Vibrio sp. ZSDE26]|uniref:Flagellar brake protein n=1 Tax=Vibrio amylolyticus TaxID=2847292 RepID=A0A9X2BK55_9VIBR|nr:PilZ domain-containing protein [Vibrio amylolyticus]MCK6264142.1 flagellar brake protein [Vibrio amylolyticus]
MTNKIEDEAQVKNEKKKAIELSSDAEQHKEEATSTETSIVYGEDAFRQVSPLSDIAFVISTPTGKVLKCRSKFIGIHPNNLLLLEKPDVSPQEFTVFFQRGYAIKACAISQKGEGARIYFKSKIEYVVDAGPECLVLISLPKATQLATGLRSEARLEIALDGLLDPEGHKYLCHIRDISNTGCQVVTDRDTNNYKLGNIVEVKILDGDCPDKSALVSGIVKNKKLSSQYWTYGIQFDDGSKDVANELLEKLSFDHARHQFLL